MSEAINRVHASSQELDSGPLGVEQHLQLPSFINVLFSLLVFHGNNIPSHLDLGLHCQ